MRLEKFIGTTLTEFKGNNHNIFFGISLGNKYFTPEHIRQYILWALDCTKEKVLVVIADSNHAINYEVFDQRSPESAMKYALRKGDTCKVVVENIVAELSFEDRERVHVIRWDDVRNSLYHKNHIRFFLDSFEHDHDFRKAVTNIVKENLGSRLSGLNEIQVAKLALYVLDELPTMVNGMELGDTVYTLHPYPGTSALDDLIQGLNHGTVFPELAKKLNVTHRVAMVEAYCE